MKIEFSHDGHTYRLNTENGEVQCDQVDPEPEQPHPLESSGENE